MRPDLAKVVTERPRRGHGRKSLKTAKRLSKDEIDHEDHGATRFPVSRKRQHGYDAKEFSDLLGPLRRLLHKHVGRRWDDIASELHRTLNKTTLSGQHIWQHIEWEVDQNAELRDDGVYIERFREFYVHPKTGILHYHGRKRAKYVPPVNPDKIQLTKEHSLQRIEGIWYSIAEGEVTIPEYRSQTTGEVLIPAKTMWKQLSKRQLDKQELKQHKLRNTPKVKPIARRKLQKGSR